MLESGRWKEAVQAYLAAISYCDAMIGRLLDAFDKSPERDNTIIVFWGDHGWHLGEKSHWRKFALWEEATRAPLIWVAPGVTKPGTVSDRTVDFMSIYPTLTDLCGIPTPKHVEGPSLRPLLENPGAAWEQPALTTYGFKNHAVRDEGWRYIRYANGDEELYDRRSAPTNGPTSPRPKFAAKNRNWQVFPLTNHADIGRQRRSARQAVALGPLRTGSIHHAQVRADRSPTASKSAPSPGLGSAETRPPTKLNLHVCFVLLWLGRNIVVVGTLRRAVFDRRHDGRAYYLMTLPTPGLFRDERPLRSNPEQPEPGPVGGACLAARAGSRRGAAPVRFRFGGSGAWRRRRPEPEDRADRFVPGLPTGRRFL